VNPILLKKHLDKLYISFDRRSVSPDPLEFLHRYKNPLDQEIVGLIASSLAYGKVEIILRNISHVLSVMGASPYKFTINFDPVAQAGLFSGFSHRFNKGRDIVCLIYFAKQIIDENGSVYNFFLKGYNPGDENIRPALVSFSRRVLSLSPSTIYNKRGTLPEGAGVRFFFPSPEQGSSCKRLNLYLRWMVRRKDVDLGLWKGIEPAKLIIPLDTHIARISGNIGLTKRKSPGWKMAEEITDNLRKLDFSDPVKYDFSLCRLGILDRCTRKKDKEKCSFCLIKRVCVL